MPTHDIIVIGGSAGGIEALTTLLSGLSADLPAAVFVVVHLSPHQPSMLPAVLARWSALSVAQATHGAPIRPGHVYVAPPDVHLLVREGHIALSRGPHENRSRPAVDPLFRSAARAYGPRLVGVVLSGALDDGMMGAMAVRAHGGIVIAQDPADALISSMPLGTIEFAGADHVLPVAAISPLLTQLAHEPAGKGGATMVDEERHAEEVIAQDFTEQVKNRRTDEPAVLTCPECGGTLWQLQDGQFVHFRCHVGHTYSAEGLLADKAEELEAALWRAVRLMKEKATLTRQMAERLRARGNTEYAKRVAEQAEQDERHVRSIREGLLEGTPAPTNQILAVLDTLQATDDED